MSDWHTVSVADALARLGTDAIQGLRRAEASQRLADHGPNELIERGARSPLAIVWEQLTSVMVVILIVAAAVSVVVGDYKDAATIVAIVLLNAALGFFQEYRAEQAMAALKRLAVPTVKVRRDGHLVECTARDLVPGDVVVLEAGNRVPADCRLVEGANLRIQESTLTGESQPVEKDPNATIAGAVPLGDRITMAYMGTAVTYGRGLGVVVETGMSTELGRIATMLQVVEREATPLQRRLDQLGRILIVASLAIVAVILALGIVRGEEIHLMLLTAISMAVAAVPEGLPAVVTIALALGAQRMLKRRALIRRLSAVETLGSTTVICSDKTGTLTENRMAVVVLDIPGQRLDVSTDVPRLVSLTGSADVAPATSPGSPGLTLLLMGSALCNDAILDQHDGSANELVALGDPTEGAMVVAAARAGFRKDALDDTFRRVAEQPFDSDRKRMTTVHALPGTMPACLRPVFTPGTALAEATHVAFTKGAVDSVLGATTEVWADGHTEPLTSEWRGRIEHANDQLARDGMRVLGVAFRRVSADETISQSSFEHDLAFVGLVGMIDPPRPEAKAAVETCRAAGIRPVMITGDHPLTAHYIARELGIARDGSVLTGQELDALSPADLKTAANEMSVFARVSPEHKLKLVQALRAGGQIVAMTGDGVNDAPALKQADIGVAMGITGTDVTKEAADMVLLDDNFATIVAAVEEGRVIYDNIRKFIKYMMTTNSAELAVMLLGPLVGMPLPLLPLQILWMNLVTDGPTAVALGFEPAEPGTMRRPPYRTGESILGQGIGRHIIWVGTLMALISLGTGYVYWRDGREQWQTMLFTTLVLAQLAHVMAIRSGRESLFSSGLLSNRPLLSAVVGSIALQLALLYVPFAQELFSTLPLSTVDLGWALLAASVIFWAVEIEKWLGRRRARGSSPRLPMTRA